MNLYTRLEQETQAERAYLTSSPIIQQVFRGDISLDDYTAFLREAYHHVKHTVPLLMATGAALPESKEWLREAFCRAMARKEQRKIDLGLVLLLCEAEEYTKAMDFVDAEKFRDIHTAILKNCTETRAGA